MGHDAGRSPTKISDNRRWKCRSCGVVSHEAELLTAPSPFDATDTLTGCPSCTACADGFDLMCDEAGCNEVACCGWPAGESRGYRNTCGKHGSPSNSHSERNMGAGVAHPTTSTLAKRNLAIHNARLTGVTLQSIADEYGLTRERVRQILKMGGAEARTIADLPGSESLAPGARALLIRLGFSTKAAVEVALDARTLYNGCTFGMGSTRFAEIERWARSK